MCVQVGLDSHVDLLNDFAYTNHCCDPNCFFDLDAMEVVMLKDIEAGDELTAFYPSFEWDMTSPFQCWCGAPNCLQHISGARHIQPEVLKAYKLSSHITLLKQQQIGC